MNTGNRSCFERYRDFIDGIHIKSNGRTGSNQSHASNGSPVPEQYHELSFFNYEAIQQKFRHLLDEASGSIAPFGNVNSSNAGDLQQSIAFYSAVERAEQQLIERAIEVIAGIHPALVMITKNKQIPITDTAQKFAEDNASIKLEGIRLRYDGRKKHYYEPSAIFIHSTTGTAHLVDYKHSRTEVERKRLKLNMDSASLILPNWLLDECDGLHINKVMQLVVNGGPSGDYVNTTEWNLSDLDDVVMVKGAAKLVKQLRNDFYASVRDELQPGYDDEAG
jgi:hypothetical protein